MVLTDYLRASAICTNLEVSQRDDAVRSLLEAFVDTGEMPADLLETALEAILDRERLGSTAIGRGVAVPHARLAELEDILVGFAFSPAGVEFNALDGAPVHEVFLIIAPKDRTDEYVTVMEGITRLVQNADFRSFVSQAAGAEDVLALIEEMAG